MTTRTVRDMVEFDPDTSMGLLTAKAVTLREALVAFMIQTYKMIRSTIRYADWRFVELWTILLASCFGGWMLGTPYSVSNMTPSMGVMVYVATRLGLTGDGMWGFLLIIGAMMQMVGYRLENPAISRGAALYLVVIWSFIAACYMTYDIRLMSTAIVPLFVLPSMWMYFRITKSEQFRHDHPLRRAEDREPPPLTPE